MISTELEGIVYTCMLLCKPFQIPAIRRFIEAMLTFAQVCSIRPKALKEEQPIVLPQSRPQM